MALLRVIGAHPMIPPMRAAILAVGSELLGEDRLDTNSLRLTETLRRYGVELARKEVVGDNVARLAKTIRRLAGGLDLILVSGGLGPTSDDVTREATALALDRGLHHDEEILSNIVARFAGFGMEMPPVNRRQAEVIDGAVVLSNPLGSAPGLRIDLDSGTIFLFPGVPIELEAMIGSALVPFLEERTDGALLETRVVRAACLSESAVEETITPLYEEFGQENISVLASPGDIQIHVSANGREAERRVLLERMTDGVAGLLGRAVYSRWEDRTLEEVVGGMLSEAGLTVATAESCTGGLVAERLTRVPGCSAYFAGAVVTQVRRLCNLAHAAQPIGGYSTGFSRRLEHHQGKSRLE